jgi:hypothetical protein
MKKIISVLMVAVCLMMAAPAQAQLHFGVKGGLNISKLSFSKDAFKGDNKTGFFVGPMAGLEARVSPILALISSNSFWLSMADSLTRLGGSVIDRRGGAQVHAV